MGASSRRRRDGAPGGPDLGAPLVTAYEVRRAVTPRAAVVLAANPSAMTLDGTNTWLLHGADDPDRVIVVDPGPDDEAHLDAVVAAAGQVVRILLTHGHPDHSDGARRLHERTGASVSALDPRWQFGAEGLRDGDVVAAAGVEVAVWATPGHTADSLSFLLRGEDSQQAAVLTGDTVLGRGSTVIAEPDGDLRAYLTSLDRLSTLGRLGDAGPVTVLPGHGPELPDAHAAAEAYLAHRRQRLAQVENALARLQLDPLAVNADAIVAEVYADVDPELWPAAGQSVRAQLAYLRASGLSAI